MGSGGDFLLGATAGVLGTIENEYDRQSKERALIAREDRMSQRAIDSEKRAEAARRRADIWAQDRERTFTELDKNKQYIDDEVERERLEQKHGKSFGNLEEATDYSKKKTSADIEIEKQEELRKRKLGTYKPSTSTTGPKGLTSADARSTFNGALADIVGVTEADARPDDKRRNRLQDFAKAENGEDVYNLITGEVTVTQNKFNPLKDNVDVREADRKMGAALKEFRDEVVWTVGRTERAKLGKDAKNNILDSDNVYAVAANAAARADAGIETVRNGLTRIHENGPPTSGTREDFYKFLRGELYESMGYEVNDPTAIAAKKLWNVYENGLNAAY